jgi:hypothetical protein
MTQKKIIVSLDIVTDSDDVHWIHKELIRMLSSTRKITYRCNGKNNFIQITNIEVIDG